MDSSPYRPPACATTVLVVKVVVAVPGVYVPLVYKPLKSVVPATLPQAHLGTQPAAAPLRP